MGKTSLSANRACLEIIIFGFGIFALIISILGFTGLGKPESNIDFWINSIYKFLYNPTIVIVMFVFSVFIIIRMIIIVEKLKKIKKEQTLIHSKTESITN